jgi:hypothetical protein
MKRNLIFAGLLLATISISSAASAQTHTPVVRKRQVHQQERIGQGVKSGELTRPETRHLEAREAKIQNDKVEAKSDGVVTHQERAKLRREQNRTSRAIYRQKHDGQERQ